MKHIHSCLDARLFARSWGDAIEILASEGKGGRVSDSSLSYSAARYQRFLGGNGHGKRRGGI